MARCRENADRGTAEDDVACRHQNNHETYGDVVMDDMSTASLKVADLSFRGNRAQTECAPR
jgi:hypothetical protein